MVRLAKPLGCDPRDLMAPASVAATRGGVRRIQSGDGVPLDLIPARGGERQEMFLTDGAIDHVPRSYYLTHVKDAYAIYVVGDSMVPMYRPRQM